MKKRTPSKRTSKVKNQVRHENGLGEALGFPNQFGATGFNNQIYGSQLSQTGTLWINNRWYLVSNMRQLLSQSYVEHGLIQAAVDMPVDDALKGGVVIKSKQMSPEEITEVQSKMEHEGDLIVVGNANKWSRLFGGAGIITMTGQDAETELDVDALHNDETLGFRAVDMWELFWSNQAISDEDYNMQTQLQEFEYYQYYQVQLHKSRVMPLKGKLAPSFVRPRLRGWGLSVVEAIIRSINQYLKSTDLVFEVLDEFKVDYFKIKNLTNSLLSLTGEAGIKKRLWLINQEKNFHNAVTMDSEDDFIQKELTFTGIKETMEGIRLQVASDLRIPVAKLFGTGATGLGSGEDDIENYNSMVENQVRVHGKRDIIRIIQLRCMQLFGYIPDDLTIEFKPLRILSAEQEENVKNSQFNRLWTTMTGGACTIQEFKEGVNQANLLPVQLDTSIDTLETENVVEGSEGGGDEESKPKEKKPPKPVTQPKQPKN